VEVCTTILNPLLCHMHDLFFAPSLPDGETHLDERESHHALKVKRHKIGDIIKVIDGRGGVYDAELTEVVSGQCHFRTLRETKVPKPVPEVHLAVAPTKNVARFEWLAEKATEIGLSRLTPVSCEHSERHRVNTERLRHIVIEAAKQSGKAWLPGVDEMIPFNDMLKSDVHERFIAHARDGSKPLKETYQMSGSTLILIGPEGDFTDDELQHAMDAGFTTVSLGPYRLRTETAALVACHTINLMHG